MTILITGVDGYIGWPLFLKISKIAPNEKIVGIDNFLRRKMVKEVGAVSAIPIASMKKRMLTAKKIGYKNIIFHKLDLLDYVRVKSLLQKYKPRLILHLASQPSAPYSQINPKKASFTLTNNNNATLNLLWALNELKFKKTVFVETTTTGVYGAPDFEIPEGFIDITKKGKKTKVPFAGMGQSWYHITKSNDANLLWLANRQWSLSILDFRTAITYGTSTKETREHSALSTRFDFDYWFGVVVNRFCAMAVSNYPLTIYGKGNQKKPMVSLDDAVDSLSKTVYLKSDNKFHVVNQISGTLSIKDISEIIEKKFKKEKRKLKIVHIKNPRVEKEDHKMKINSKKFKKILGRKPNNLSKGIYDILSDIYEHKKTILKFKQKLLNK